jgi:hypothetical protein
MCNCGPSLTGAQLDVYVAALATGDDRLLERLSPKVREMVLRRRASTPAA